MKTNTNGVSLIKKWEGLRTRAYFDGGGVLTIGYGHTSAAGAPVVKVGMNITEQAAEDILKLDLAKFEKRVNSFVKVPLNDNQFAALVSFDYNTGALGTSTLLKKLNAGNYSAVPSELRKWVHDNGKVVKGLVNRREDEIKLWNKPVEKVSSVSVLPAEEAAKGSGWGALFELILSAFKGK